MVSCPGIPGRILTPIGLRMPMPGRIPMPMPGITNPMPPGFMPELAKLMEFMAMVFDCRESELRRADDD